MNAPAPDFSRHAAELAALQNSNLDPVVFAALIALQMRRAYAAGRCDQAMEHMLEAMKEAA
jgi:hypothetical protein